MWKLSLFFLTCAGWTVAQSNDTAAVVDNPCAEASKLYQESTEPAVVIPAKLAYDCITSVPINAERATELMKSLIAYSEWQSTLDYLKDPPSDYAYPAIDIIKEFQNITDSIESGIYEKEYEYATEVHRVVQQSHDGHFSFQPDILFNAFTFARTVQLVSVSIDGKELPKVYVIDDLNAGERYSPSSVTSIDGRDVTDFLESELVHPCHDPDACYNWMFYHHNQFGATGGLGQFSLPMKYVGESTALAFENGTTTDAPNRALVIGNFTSIDGPEDFYERFCNVSEVANATKFGLVNEEVPRTLPIEPYPQEVVANEAKTVVGYFIDDDGFEDIGVLLLPIFLTDPISHQQTVKEFFKRCRESGKTKLVLDLQGNMGGVRTIPYDIFNQIFPDIDSTLKERMRAHESLDTLGQMLATVFANEEIISPENITREAIIAHGVSFNIYNRRPINGGEFTSWSDYYGPNEIRNGQYTANYERTFEEPSHLILDGFNIPTGYGDQTTGGSRVFEDVIMLTDGRCGSACSMLASLLREKANVRSVTIGGRAEHGPMKAVGSTRGTHVYGSSTIAMIINWLKKDVDNIKREELESGKIALLNDVPNKRSQTGSFNLNMVDDILLDDESETPLQFIYEAADCRLFYTPEMISDGSAAWKAAARVMNGDYDMCISNSTNHPTSITGSGNATIPVPGDVDDDALSSPVTKDDVNAGLKTAVSAGLLITFSAMASLLM